MNNFSLSLSPYISPNTKISVYDLIVNEKDLFNEFYDEIEKNGNLFKDLASAIRIIEDTANLIRKPKTKFREIKGHKLNCKIYEAKKGIIRIYLFHEKNTGRIIVSGGLKDTQDKDIKKIISIIKDYYNEKY